MMVKKRHWINIGVTAGVIFLFAFGCSSAGFEEVQQRVQVGFMEAEQYVQTGFQEAKQRAQAVFIAAAKPKEITMMQQSSKEESARALSETILESVSGGNAEPALETILESVSETKAESALEGNAESSLERSTEPVSETYAELVSEGSTERGLEANPETGSKPHAKTVLESILCTAKDYQVLLNIVQAEAGGCDAIGKILVANVILNRVRSERFPNTITDVVYEKSQFSPVITGAINQVEVSDSTKNCVLRALSGEDYSQGALYFMNRRASQSGKVSWFDQKLTYLFQYEAHEFFK